MSETKQGTEKRIMDQKDKTPMLLWIDVETTALSPLDGDLLEAEMVVTTLQGIEHGRWHAVIKPEDGIRFNADTEAAFGMHVPNGLLGESLHHGIAAERAADGMSSFLGEWLGRHSLHPAGTNVDFDLIWLDAKLPSPRLMDLSHRKLDMSSLRLWQLANGVDPYQEAYRTNHRTTNCLKRDIEAYRRLIEENK